VAKPSLGRRRCNGIGEAADMDTVSKGNGRGAENSVVELLGCLDSGPITEKREPCSSIDEFEKADPALMAKLDIDSKGQVRNSINNIMIIMTNDNKWANRLSFNSFSNTVMLDDQQLVDTAITELRIDICRRYKIEVGKSKIWAVADLVARRNIINPLTEYLDSLRWDGKKRISTWIIPGVKYTFPSATITPPHARGVRGDGVPPPS